MPKKIVGIRYENILDQPEIDGLDSLARLAATKTHWLFGLPSLIHRF